MRVTSVKAYGTTSAEADLKQFNIDRRPISATDETIDMKSLNAN